MSQAEHPSSNLEFFIAANDAHDRLEKFPPEGLDSDRLQHDFKRFIGVLQPGREIKITRARRPDESLDNNNVSVIMMAQSDDRSTNVFDFSFLTAHDILLSMTIPKKEEDGDESFAQAIAILNNKDSENSVTLKIT